MSVPMLAPNPNDFYFSKVTTFHGINKIEIGMLFLRCYRLLSLLYFRQIVRPKQLNDGQIRSDRRKSGRLGGIESLKTKTTKNSKVWPELSVNSKSVRQTIVKTRDMTNGNSKSHRE